MNTAPAIPTLHSKHFVRRLVCAIVFFGVTALTGCTGLNAAPKVSLEAIARMSPAPTVVTPFQAIEFANQYVKQHPGSDYAIGSGDSMKPLYQDRDVIIIERPALGDLKVGQTVVFMSAAGVPVAHLVFKHTSRGWATMGLNNGEVDEETLTEGRYVGIVVKAYHPTGSPILAYWSTSPKNVLAANP